MANCILKVNIKTINNRGMKLSRINGLKSVKKSPMVEVSDLDPMHSSHMPVSLHPFCLNRDLWDYWIYMIFRLLHLNNLRRMKQTPPIVPPMVEVIDLDPMHSLCMPVSMHPSCRNWDLQNYRIYMIFKITPP